MTDQEVKVKYSVDGVDQSSKQTSKLSDAVQKLKENWVVASAALVGVVATFKSFYNEAMRSIQVSKQTEQVIKSTGAAAGMTARAVESLANELSRATNIEDDAIQSGENMLLTFTNIGKDIFPQATEAMLNMSTAMNGGVTPSAEALKSTAIQLGKALNDPTEGAAALRRVGVALTEQQMEQIKAFQASGNVLEAQKIIIKELGIEFGGLAKSLANPMEQAGNSLKNVQEVLGRLIVSALIPFAKGITFLADGFLSLTPTVQKALGAFVLIGVAISGLIPLWGVLTAVTWAATWPILAVVAAIAAVAAGVVLLANAITPLSEKTNQLAKEHDNLTSKTKSLKDQMKALEDQGKKNGSEYLKLQKELENTNVNLTKNEEKLRSNIKALNDQKKAIEDKIAAQKLDVEQASGDKKIKELEELEKLEDEKTAIMAAQHDARTALLLEKDIEAHSQKQLTMAEMELADAENKQALKDEEDALKAEKDAIELQEFLGRLQWKSDAELQKEGYTVSQIKSIRSLQKKDLEKNVHDWAGFVSAAGEKEVDVGRAVAQGTLEWAKAGLKAQAQAYGEKLVVEGASTLPLLLIGDMSPLLKMASGAALIGGAGAAINKIQLAEGGSMIVDQPTQIGGNVIAGEVPGSPERIDVTPLDQQEPRTIINNIILDGEVIATQVAKINQQSRTEGTLDDQL